MCTIIIFVHKFTMLCKYCRSDKHKTYEHLCVRCQKLGHDHNDFHCNICNNINNGSEIRNIIDENNYLINDIIGIILQYSCLCNCKKIKCYNIQKNNMTRKINDNIASLNSLQLFYAKRNFLQLLSTIFILIFIIILIL